jgi:hypothetical protein
MASCGRFWGTTPLATETHLWLPPRIEGTKEPRFEPPSVHDPADIGVCDERIW